MICGAAFFVFLAQQAAWFASAAVEQSPNCRVDPRAAVDSDIAQPSRSLLQARHQQSFETTLEGPLAMTEAVTNVDTPFSWAKLETTPDPKLYGDTVGGRCLKIEGSAEIKICECQTKPKDCSKGVKNDYAATVPRDKSTITNITENHIRLAFEGDVPPKKKRELN